MEIVERGARSGKWVGSNMVSGILEIGLFGGGGGNLEFPKMGLAKDLVGKFL